MVWLLRQCWQNGKKIKKISSFTCGRSTPITHSVLVHKISCKYLFQLMLLICLCEPKGVCCQCLKDDIHQNFVLPVLATKRLQKLKLCTSAVWCQKRTSAKKLKRGFVHFEWAWTSFLVMHRTLGKLPSHGLHRERKINFRKKDYYEIKQFLLLNSHKEIKKRIIIIIVKKKKKKKKKTNTHIQKKAYAKRVSSNEFSLSFW